MEKRRTFRRLVRHTCFTIFWQFVISILILYLLPLMGISFGDMNGSGGVFLRVFSWIYISIVLLTLISFHFSRMLRRIRQEMDLTNQCSEWILHTGEERDFAEAIGKLQVEEFYRTASHVEEMKKTIRGMIEQEKKQKEELILQVSAAAHDVKTPLTVIKGNAELLLMQKGADDADRQCVEDIQAAGDQMEGYVNHLIRYTKTFYEDGAGFCEISLSAFGEELSQQARLTLQGRAEFTAQIGKAENSNAGVAPAQTGEGKASNDIIFLHPEYVARAVSDMISNACAHAKTENLRVRLSMEIKDEMLFITVWNSGSCVSKEVQEHFGTLFYRKDCSRTAQEEHYGIGLAFINRVAQMHGGTAWILNKDGGVETGMSIPVHKK